MIESLLTSLTLELGQARFSRLGPHWRDVDFSDEWTRLYLIDGGLGRVRHHGREFILRPGRAYLIPAGTVFSYACERSLDQHWVHFSAFLPGGIPLFALLEPDYEIVPAEVGHVRWMFTRLEALEAGRGPAADMEKTGLLLQLVAAFLKSVGRERLAERRKAYLRFRETLAHVETHLGEPLRIGMLARQAHLERTYFSRLFRACLGVRPAEYVIRRRVERAKARLWGTDDTLQAVAGSLGFTDAFHLSKCFKRLTGMTPSGFRALRTRPTGRDQAKAAARVKPAAR